MVAFNNVRLDYPNVSFGPDSGRIYSIDHTTDTMVVKTNPGGTLVSTIPLDTSVQNEVTSFDYDGYYFYTLSNLGLAGDLGVVIQKWKLDGSTLKKQLGASSEIVLSNNASYIFESEAMTVHKISTTLSGVVASGATSVTLTSVEFLEIGDSLYLGPSSVVTGVREAHVVANIVGNTVTLSNPTSVGFNPGNGATYKKDIWLFNNRNGTDPSSGGLIKIDGNAGYIVGNNSGGQWKHVTAAGSIRGNIAFIRNSQYLEYRPLGVNAGYQSSLLLQNIETDKTTIIKVYDIALESDSVHKLQLKQHQFNGLTNDFEDVASTDGKYNLDREFFTPTVKSVAAVRNKGVLFGVGYIEEFRVRLLDQYNIPVLGRSVTVTEDDVSGYIEAGYTSFVTNSQGEGVSRYNTGISPNFNYPTISVTDVSSGLRLRLNVDQYPKVNTIGLVTQKGKVSSRLPVYQQRKSFRMPLVQAIRKRLNMPLYQQKPPETFTRVDQIRPFSTLGVPQNRPLESNLQVVQAGKTVGEAEVNQFDFLIFAIPEPYSIKNPPDTNILVRIIGFGAVPLNSSTLIFKVNGEDVANFVTVTPFGGGLELLYNPALDFDYSSTVSVEIEITDTALPPNTVKTEYVFSIVNDSKSPFLYQVFPPNNSINNSTATEIFGIIKDLETGINLSSIEMYINGKQVAPNITVIDEETTKVSYTPSCPFTYLTEVSAAILAVDNEGNKLVGSWSFMTRASSGVLFINNNPEHCDVLIPVTTDIRGEVFGLEDGIHIESMDFTVDGQKVVYLLKPKVYRRE